MLRKSEGCTKKKAAPVEITEARATASVAASCRVTVPVGVDKFNRGPLSKLASRGCVPSPRGFCGIGSCSGVDIDVGRQQAVEYGARFTSFKVENELAEALVVVFELKGIDDVAGVNVGVTALLVLGQSQDARTAVISVIHKHDIFGAWQIRFKFEVLRGTSRWHLR